MLRPFLPAFLAAAAAFTASAMEIKTTELLYRADFTAGLADWVLEQQPGGTVTTTHGELHLDVRAGATVWLRQPLAGPILIRYRVRMSSTGRVSDLNCFWMASDPRHPTDLFHADHSRNGRFGTYDALQLYYVGYGGNTNTTTRFRRYDGTGARPLDPAHDLTTAPYLLQPDHTYTIELIAAGGRAIYRRDGEVIFDYTDPAPLTRGWFGFRTVNSATRISSFEVHRLAKTP